jgi:anthranilate synthase
MRSFVFAAPLIPLISVLILSNFVFKVPITDAFISGNARRIDHLHPLKGLSSKDIGSEELSLGAPRRRPQSREYTTLGGVQVNAAVNDIQNPIQTIERLVDALDSKRGICCLLTRYDEEMLHQKLFFPFPFLLGLGALFASSYEFPGRYSRWTLGFVNPPLVVTGRGRTFTVTALNARGEVLLCAVESVLRKNSHVVNLEQQSALEIQGEVIEPQRYFPEEERSRQPSLFSVVRSIVDCFYHKDDPQLGLYGAFGYDLTFQFEPIKLVHARSSDQNDILLYLPDQIIVVDTKSRDAWEIRYDFTFRGATTNWIARDGPDEMFIPSCANQVSPKSQKVRRDMPSGEFSRKVETAKGEFKVGNLFEAVLSQTFAEPCLVPPSQLFRRLRARNPAPYGFLMNLGSQEYLVGASPEMFVRCERTPAGVRVETCPISGTIARGSNAIEDAARIKAILGNPKEESELTMCTDVDRNDKSRICIPGSVRVLGRRQIEMYSRLIHTVDHVEGYLRDGFDALDAFLCHTWAVTVTGAPKPWAIQFVEQQEASPREWYGGAVGIVGFDGHLNTGLTLRTVHIKECIGKVRAGATLLFDSDPESEERETELKASAMLDALIRPDVEESESMDGEFERGSESGTNRNEDIQPRVLLVDHEDSFVHTLANYLRQIGAEVVTARSGPPAMHILDQCDPATSGKKIEDPWVPDLVVLSPGPGRPEDFGLSETIERLIKLEIPAFGVCLGLQGVVQYFGGELGVLPYPMHGKPSEVMLVDRNESFFPIFEGLPHAFEVARYHSLHGVLDTFPNELRVTALTKDGVVCLYRKLS